MSLSFASLFSSVQAQESEQSSRYDRSALTRIDEVETSSRYTRPTLTRVEAFEVPIPEELDLSNYEINRQAPSQTNLQNTTRVEKESLLSVKERFELMKLEAALILSSSKERGRHMQDQLRTSNQAALDRSTVAIERMRNESSSRLEKTTLISQLLCSGAMLGASISVQASSTSKPDLPSASNTIDGETADKYLEVPTTASTSMEQSTKQVQNTNSVPASTISHPTSEPFKLGENSSSLSSENSLFESLINDKSNLACHEPLPLAQRTYSPESATHFPLGLTDSQERTLGSILQEKSATEIVQPSASTDQYVYRGSTGANGSEVACSLRELEGGDALLLCKRHAAQNPQMNLVAKYSNGSALPTVTGKIEYGLSEIEGFVVFRDGSAARVHGDFAVFEGALNLSAKDLFKNKTGGGKIELLNVSSSVGYTSEAECIAGQWRATEITAEAQIGPHIQAQMRNGKPKLSTGLLHGNLSAGSTTMSTKFLNPDTAARLEKICPPLTLTRPLPLP